MSKIKIRFTKVEDKEFLVKTVSHFYDDVNIYDGHKVFDAKDINTVGKLILHKVYEVELLNDDHMAQDDMRLFLNKITVD